jgi:hypothetical protein
MEGIDHARQDYHTYIRIRPLAPLFCMCVHAHSAAAQSPCESFDQPDFATPSHTSIILGFCGMQLVAHEQLAPFFKRANMTQLRNHQTRLLTMVCAMCQQCRCGAILFCGTAMGTRDGGGWLRPKIMFGWTKWADAATLFGVALMNER